MNRSLAHGLLLAALVVLPTADAQDSSAKYPESKDGFKRYIAELVNQKASGDESEFSLYVEGAMLPDADVWMKETFGDTLGPAIARDYTVNRSELVMALSISVDEVLKRGLTEIEVLEYRGPELKLEGRAQRYLGLNLQALRPVRVFGARFSPKGRSSREANQWIAIRYFVYVGGSYRYVGFFESRCEEPIPVANPALLTQSAAPKRIRMGGNVQQAKLIRQVAPSYPLLARQQRIQGTVHMQVVISRQGCIKELEVLSGHPMLVQAAQDAVRGWMYRPTSLNGEAVEVVSTIDIVFTLGG